MKFIEGRRNFIETEYLFEDDLKRTRQAWVKQQSDWLLFYNKFQTEHPDAPLEEATNDYLGSMIPGDQRTLKNKAKGGMSGDPVFFFWVMSWSRFL